MDASEVKKIVDYTKQFQEALDELAVTALQPTSEFIVMAVVRTLYAPKEIVCAAATAQALRLTPAEGAASLAMLTALAEAEGRGENLLGATKDADSTSKGNERISPPQDGGSCCA